MPKPPSDRILDEYIRQLKAPKVSEEVAPNLTKAFDPLSIDKTEQENYQALGENTPFYQFPYLADLINEPRAAQGWLQRAETKAGSSVAKDVHKTEDVKQLLESLKKEKNLDFTFKPELNEGFFGRYDPESNVLTVNRNRPNDVQLDTAIHETGHAVLARKNPRTFAQTVPVEGELGTPQQYAEALRNRDLYGLSELYSRGHFERPRSYTINYALDHLKRLLEQQGMEPNPDDNPRFNELEFIKEQLRKSEGIDKPRSRFNKTKKTLGTDK